MSFTAAAGGFLVLLFTLTVVTGRGSWSVSYASRQICALKGSTVSIQCSYGYPSNEKTTVVKRFWFTKQRRNPLDLMKDPNYAGRVSYDSEERNCSLRITDLRESDSAVYTFRFTTNPPKGGSTGSPGVTLTVTDLRVQMRRLSVQTELRCESSCRVTDRPSYVWYKNGEKMTEETPSIRVTGREYDFYSCAFKGHEDYRSPSEYVEFLFVSVSPFGEIREGSSVTLTCNYHNQAATFYWYRNNHSVTANKQLIIPSITSSDSGEYFCTIWISQWTDRSMSVFIDVKYAPKLPAVSVSPSGELRESSYVTLTCYSDAKPAAEYKWFRRNQVSHLTADKRLIFTSITSSDSGEYHCTAVNKLGNETSQPVVIDVKYAPKFSVLSVSPSGGLVEGGSVTLICNSDSNPAATYYWFKTDQYVGAGKYLTFKSIASLDSGEYQCEAGNRLGSKRSQVVFVDVKYAPKSLSVSGISSDGIVEGSSVTLTCSSDANPSAKYSWYRKNIHKPVSEGLNLVFLSIQSFESGEYYCTAENDLGSRTSEAVSVDVKYAPRPPTVSVHPSGEVTEGVSVTLTCSSDANPAANYTWYMQGEESPKAAGQNFSISSISFQHRGFYHCEAQNSRGRHNATLQLQVVTSLWKLTTAAAVPALLAVALVPLMVWIIKNKTSKQQSEPGERRDTWEQVKPAEDDVVYTTVFFTKKQADPVCFSFRSHQLGRHVKVKRREETVVYTTVKFNSNRSDVRTETRDQEAVEDPDALYSTINQ